MRSDPEDFESGRNRRTAIGDGSQGHRPGSGTDDARGHEVVNPPRRRIERPVERTSADESAAYIRTRPRSSQVSALASPQSQTIESREELERRVADLERRYAGSELPMPTSWGGFRLVPEALEFWQQRHDRLHDRLSFRRAGEGWRVERLAP